jgi:hypothetical protein
MLNGQKLMIKIATNLLQFTENFPIALRPELFRIIRMIIERKDLNLSNLMFNRFLTPQIFSEIIV